MSSLSQKDRASSCSFTFSDGRRCRSPRIGSHPLFCPDHAEKEARVRTAQKLGNDLAYFFSGSYLSANDLTTALGRIIPAVIRGDVKPRTARTVAYLAQTLLQTIHFAQQEYTNAFGSDAWRRRVCNSVNGNYDHRFPPVVEPERSGGLQAGTAAPAEHPAQPQPPAAHTASPANCHSERSEESASSPSPAPHTPLPSTSAEFVQRVVPASTPPKATPSSPSASPTTAGAPSPAPLQTQAQPASPEQCRMANPREPNRDAPWLNFGEAGRIPPDSKLL